MIRGMPIDNITASMATLAADMTRLDLALEWNKQALPMLFRCLDWLVERLVLMKLPYD